MEKFLISVLHITSSASRLCSNCIFTSSGELKKVGEIWGKEGGGQGGLMEQHRGVSSRQEEQPNLTTEPLVNNLMGGASNDFIHSFCMVEISVWKYSCSPRPEHLCSQWWELAKYSITVWLGVWPSHCSTSDNFISRLWVGLFEFIRDLSSWNG